MNALSDEVPNVEGRLPSQVAPYGRGEWVQGERLRYCLAGLLTGKFDCGGFDGSLAQ